MANKYLIVETTFAYNDEYYYPQEGGVTPKVIYDNQEDALVECARLNKKSQITHKYIYDQYEDEDGFYGDMPDVYTVIEVEYR